MAFSMDCVEKNEARLTDNENGLKQTQPKVRLQIPDKSIQKILG